MQAAWRVLRRIIQKEVGGDPTAERRSDQKGKKLLINEESTGTALRRKCEPKGKSVRDSGTSQRAGRQ